MWFHVEHDRGFEETRPAATRHRVAPCVRAAGGWVRLIPLEYVAMSTRRARGGACKARPASVHQSTVFLGYWGTGVLGYWGTRAVKRSRGR